MIIKAAPGESLQLQCRLKDRNGNPIDKEAPVTWKIYDGDDYKVGSGFGTQDVIDPTLWYSTFTLPKDIPIYRDGRKYAIEWQAKDRSKLVSTAVEYFDVVETGDASVMPATEDTLVWDKGALSDTLMLEGKVSNISYSIYSETGAEVMTNDRFSIQASRDGRYTVYSANAASHTLQPSKGGMGFYLGVWSWQTTLSTVETEMHPVYVINTGGLQLVNNLRKLIDRARIKDIHPYLEFKDVDLVHYVTRGMAYVNAAMPIQTNFSFVNLPFGLTEYIDFAAALFAIKAQYLAEGQSAFNFQGLGVQLDVDKTPYYEAFASWLENELQRLPDAKKAWMNAGKPTNDDIANGGQIRRPLGYSSVSVGPYTNYAYKPPAVTIIPGISYFRTFMLPFGGGNQRL